MTGSSAPVTSLLDDFLHQRVVDHELAAAGEDRWLRPCWSTWTRPRNGWTCSWVTNRNSPSGTRTGPGVACAVAAVTRCLPRRSTP